MEMPQSYSSLSPPLGDRAAISSVAHISDWAWIPRECVDVHALVDEFTLVGTTYGGTNFTREFFVLTDTHIALPRMAAAKFATRFAWEDRTTFREIPWPGPIFPPGNGYRTGQKEAIEACLTALRAINCVRLEAGCGTGKTVMSLCVAAELNVRTLIVVHKEDLMDQWEATIRGSEDRWGFFPTVSVGRVKAQRWDHLDKSVVIASAQTLYRANEAGRVPEDIIRGFGLTIYDEGHRYPAETFAKVLALPQSRYKLGVSATWRRKDGLEAAWAWHLGPVAASLALPVIEGSKYIQVKFQAPYLPVVSQARIVKAYVEHGGIRKWLLDNIQNASSAERRVLVCSDRREHLIELKEQLATRGVDAGLCLGGTKAENRRLAVQASVLLGTYHMLAEGTDIPQLDTLFLATPRSDVEQVVGRLFRRADKKPILVVDIVLSDPYSAALADKRVRVFERLGLQKYEGTNDVERDERAG